MRLIQNEEIKFARKGWSPFHHIVEETHGSLALEKIQRGDQTRKMRPGVHLQAS